MQVDRIFTKASEDFTGIKLVYLDGTAEIMPIGRAHEDFKSTIVRLIEAYMDAKGIYFDKRGSPSLGNKELGVRNEPDESYNLNTPKFYPDLVTEVVVTSGGVNKLEGYRHMGVREVWRWEDCTLEIHRLDNDGYEQSSQASVGKVAKSCQDQDSGAKPALCAAVLPKRLCCHIQLK